MIRLVADENIQASLVRALREDGHDVLYVAENAGVITDNAALAWAAEQERILLTEDKDFGQLVFRLKRDLPGVILLRLPDVHWQSRYPRLTKLFERYGGELRRQYVVVEEERFRFRNMP